MKSSLANAVARMLREIADRIDSGDNSEMSESEAMDIMSTLCHHVMSKDTASRYLNLSKSHFDTLIRERKIPKGRKRVGFKELVWYKDELDECIKKIRNKI